MPYHLPELPLTNPAWVFAVIAAVVLLSPILSRALRVPEVVTLVLLGTLVGGGLGLLQRDGAIALVGGIGLLYLMFIAGLELDLDEFVANQRDSWIFGTATFVTPMVIGTGAAIWLGYGWLAALLIGSCWASHTLVSYPIFQRFNAVRHRAVSTSVGATIITDTAALLVLAVVAGIQRGTVGPTFWLGLFGGATVVAAFGIMVLPRLGRWFFAGLGQDQTARFFFLMVALAVTAGLAETAGIEAIVGAFLAGLALNRLVPKHGALMERIEFLGSRLLVPIFLISVGMLIEPRAVLNFETLKLAGVLTLAAVGSKWLAAEISGRLLGYDAAGRGAMFGLSVNQAAATLAAVIVGVQVGLVDEPLVRAVVLVILVTCILGSWSSSRFAPRLHVEPNKQRPLGETVVVPISNPSSANNLVGLAAELASSAAGSMIPLTVVDPGVGGDHLAERRQTNKRAEAMARAKAVEASGLVRIDASPASGTLHTVVEYNASAVVLGWKGYSGAGENLFGGIIDEVLDRVTCPALVARLREEPYDRVVLSVSEANLSAAGLPSLRRAVEAAKALQKALVRTSGRAASKADRKAGRTPGEAKLTVVGDVEPNRLAKVLDVPLDDLDDTVLMVHDQRRPAIAVRSHAEPHDLLVIPAIPTYRSLRGEATKIARARGDCGVLVVFDGGQRP